MLGQISPTKIERMRMLILEVDNPVSMNDMASWIRASSNLMREIVNQFDEDIKVFNSHAVEHTIEKKG